MLSANERQIGDQEDFSEEDLALINKLLSRIVHAIAKEHFDIEWLWGVAETYHGTAATVKSIVKELEARPDATCSVSEPLRLLYVELLDPELMQKFRSLVKEGRIEITGWPLEPDCNSPGGASFARYGLEGQALWERLFGKRASVCGNFDSFGHHANIPAFLAQQGYGYYVHGRPRPEDSDRLQDNPYRWRTSSGDSVLSLRLPSEYAVYRGDFGDNQLVRDSQLFPAKNIPFPYGIGNHGGGPSRQQLEEIERLQALGIDIRHSTWEEFFEEFKKEKPEVPAYRGEINEIFRGCYINALELKRRMREAEHLLLFAEKMSVLAMLKTPYTYPDLREIWYEMFFNQHHDILGGTAIPSVMERALDRVGGIISATRKYLDHATQVLAWRIDTRFERDGEPLIVFNPHPWDTQQAVSYEVYNLSEDAHLIDPTTGNVVPMQRSASRGGHENNTITFMPEGIPEMGYKVYLLVREKPPVEYEQMKVDGTSVENDYLKLEVDPETGYISLHHKELDYPVFSGPGAAPVVVNDPSDAWGYNITHFNEFEGAFTLDKSVENPIEVLSTGPVYTTFRVSYIYNNSTLVQEFTMYKDLPYIEVNVSVDWQEEMKLLKIELPLNLFLSNVAAEIPYGTIRRAANGEEVTMQRFLNIDGGAREVEKGFEHRSEPYGVAICNNGLHGCSVIKNPSGSTAYLSVVRTPPAAMHTPKKPSPGDKLSYIDKGYHQDIRYTIEPHAGVMREAAVARRADEINSRLYPALVTQQDGGTLPKELAFIKVDHHNVIIPEVKQAEAGGAVVLRCVNMDDTAVQAVVEIPIMNRSMALSFKPGEIKTVIVPIDEQAAWYETNMLEDEKLPSKAEAL